MSDNTEQDYNNEVLIQSSIGFMKALITVYGAEKGEEMWDTIVTTLDPGIKRRLLMMMLTGNFGTKLTLRGFRGSPKKVTAIKAVRTVTGMGLKESKEVIDRVYGNFVRDMVYGLSEVTLGEPVDIETNMSDRVDAIMILESAGCVVL